MPRRFTMLLIIAAVARLWMHMAAMPPYAGLDEVYHVARLAFVLQEHRNPNIVEKSVPPYLEASMSAAPNALPAFCLVGPTWPDVVRSRPILTDHILTASDLRPYTRANYEAQQPPLYYSLIAPVVKLLPARTPVMELRAWRAISAFFALIVVIATAFLGHRLAGAAGTIAAPIMFMLPTWFTLLIRASNDAMACACVAVAIAITAWAPRRGAIAEAVAWALALAVKLYTWPVAIVAPFFWRRQKANKARIAIVCAACVISVAFTVIDLTQRTRNPIGNFGFDPATQNAAAPTSLRIVDMIKITIASGIWTSGQHVDAMRPVAMAIYVLPVIAIVAYVVVRRRGSDLTILLIALATMFVAQIVNAMAFARHARAAGLDLPLGGKEGWYWYVLAPLAVATLFARAPRLIGGWLLIWDILVTEVALFHDYAGTSSPAHPSALFRWGPLQAPFTAGLAAIGTGPLAGYLPILRAVEIAAILALFLQGSSSDDRRRFADIPVPDRSH